MAAKESAITATAPGFLPFGGASAAKLPAQACLGEGTMPADVVQGVDAEDVAKFVSRVAGQQ